jgi:hypothetical protein
MFLQPAELMYRIRDWDKHFENAQSRRFATTKWVSMPNKRGYGYTKMLKQPNGEAMFGCWCSIVEYASTCEKRGDIRSGDRWLSATDIADVIAFSEKTVKETIKFCSQALDWIEDMTSNTAVRACSDSSKPHPPGVIPFLSNPILSSPILSDPSEEGVQGGTEKSLHTQIIETWFRVFEEIRKVKPAFIRHGKGNYPKAAQALAELNRPIQEYEKAMRNGFADDWHGPKMALLYLAEHFNELLTWTPPKPKHQIGPQPVSKEFLKNQMREFMERTAHERQ